MEGYGLLIFKQKSAPPHVTHVVAAGRKKNWAKKGTLRAQKNRSYIAGWALEGYGLLVFQQIPVAPPPTLRT